MEKVIIRMSLIRAQWGNNGNEYTINDGEWQCDECGRIHQADCGPTCQCLDPESEHTCR